MENYLMKKLIKSNINLKLGKFTTKRKTGQLHS